ncbi:MAG TPA: Cthe_2314 family HEPN domain-containing protein [candidate division Zixibacteria bacterium]
MEYQEYQNRVKIRERIDKELPRLYFNLDNRISDPFNEEEINRSNSAAWLQDIWLTYSYARWSLLEAFSYLELEYEVAFLYYSDNAVFRLHALPEKVVQMINCYYGLEINIEDVTFHKFFRYCRGILKKLNPDLFKVLDDLKKNTQFQNLIKKYRHLKIHRMEPYLKEMDNYRFLMKKVDSKRIDLIGDTGNFEWTIPKLREDLFKSYETIINFVTDTLRLLFGEEVSVKET